MHTHTPVATHGDSGQLSRRPWEETVGGRPPAHLQSFSYLGDSVDGGSRLQQQLHDPDMVLLAGDV